MAIRPEEITDILKREIEGYRAEAEEVNYGSVIQVGDNIATIYGLSEARAGELLNFKRVGVFGIVFNLEEDTIGCVILGRDTEIKEGDIVERTGKIVEVPAGESLLGRVLDPLGRPIDGKGPLGETVQRPIEARAPGVVERQPVSVPVQTGLKAIDTMVPIGRGQRELIIGDRQTGKTAIGIDAILNQADENMICIYVAVGQKTNSVAAVVDILEKAGAMKYTIVVGAFAHEPPSLLYLAPYAGCAMGEYFRDKGKDVLIIYDDLTKHAKAYREMSLLLRRPPGREAYPGDVFYLHSRLLERAARLSEKLGGGSMTALPIIETQLGDVSAYIPTNVISITDGQIYLDTSQFYQGIRPAVDVGLSVSRVGGSAQIKAMKQVAGQLRLDLAQYRALAAFTKLSADELDKASRDQLTRGERVVNTLKQRQFMPMPVQEQIVVVFAATHGYMDDLPGTAVADFEARFLSYVKANKPEILSEIKEKKALSDDMLKKLDETTQAFKKQFVAERKQLMAGVRDIVGRIKTVQNIQQITKAMKMVAAARIKRAEQRLKAARPYTQKMEEVLDDLVSAMGGSAHPLMSARPAVKTIGLVVVSADKGLCGAYNSQLLRKVQQFLNEVPKGTEVRIIVFGSKALRWLNRRRLPVETQVTNFKAGFDEAQSVAQQVTQWFVEDKVQEVHAIYTEVVTAMTQRPRGVKVLPLARESGKAQAALAYDFEPSPEEALNIIVPRYLESRLYLMLLEARAAELSARLKAMSNATDNAEKVVATLRLQYFRARQDQITGELIEIASGAASLKK